MIIFSKNAALRTGDIIIIIAALLLASVILLATSARSYGNNTQALVAEVYSDGQLTHTISITEKTQELRLESAAGYNVIQIGPEGVRVIESNCHNQDCVHAGLQNRPGGMIACLPNRLLVLISGGKGAKFDAVTR